MCECHPYRSSRQSAVMRYYDLCFCSMLNCEATSSILNRAIRGKPWLFSNFSCAISEVWIRSFQ